MSKEKEKVTFRLKNNASQSFGIAGKLCVAGSGNPTPEKARADGVIFPEKMALTEDEMFKSYRGVLAHMNQFVEGGKRAIEVFIDGVPTPLTYDDITNWAAEHRAARGWAEPKNDREHGLEVERAMNRTEDPIETALKRGKAEDHAALVEAVTKTVLAVLRAEKAENATQVPSPPAQTRGRGA